jgi:hypothetical protein
MRMYKRHECLLDGTVGQVVALVGDLDRIWPTEIAPSPRRCGHRLYVAGMMVWKEFHRPGAARAFRVISPHGLQAEHWFDVERSGDGTLLRHTVEGEAVGECEVIWREHLAPLHDRLLVGLFDNVKAALASADCGSS